MVGNVFCVLLDLVLSVKITYLFSGAGTTGKDRSA